MSAVPVPLDPGRRRLTARQAEVLDRLVEAAAEEAREKGYEGLTVRSAAARASVATATAYNLVASKDHLLAEVMGRELAKVPASKVAPGASPTERVVAELRVLGTLMADDPRLAAAGTTALLGPGPDVRDVRERMARAINARLGAALGDRPDPVVLRTLDLLYTGTLLSMGMGHLSSDEVPGVLAEAAELVMRGGA